ncbi:MAG: hypothetical protein JST29_05275 [Bacteroidetes bacterium]|nr:hypothetical protein [Bacteroidota bacterium]MBS1592657.1 hypothetical protein [Bacteroidota bacterium]
MERVETLINKLKEQFEQQVGNDKLIITAQMLLTELQAGYAEQISGKVSVIMPHVSFATVAEVVEQKVEKTVVKKEPIKEQTSLWNFDAVQTIPTLAHHINKDDVAKEVYELNETMADAEQSLNDKLKENKTEIANILHDTPVRDLKKAVGINDKYLIINELFRGDEIMYERSIKTINGFSIYPEAEFWIKRELKTKLGWSDTDETVQLFDTIVKRRFS